MSGRSTARLSHLQITASEEGLARAAGAYLAFVARYRVPADLQTDMYVVLEEIVSNVVRHGAPAGEVDVQFSIDAQRFSIEVIDDGPPFDPLAAPAPDLALPLEERPIGGLGVSIALRLAACSYARREGRNHLTMSRALDGRGVD